MSKQYENFELPTGRLIMGDPWTKNTTDHQNRPIPPDDQEFFFGVAVEKTAPGLDVVFGQAWKAATAGFQHRQDIIARMTQSFQGGFVDGFSWKIEDGDKTRVNPDTGATEPRYKYGAGCWIFKFSGKNLVGCAVLNDAGVPVWAEPDQIKRGYYVRVAGSFLANGLTDHNAGIKVYPQTVLRVGFGEEITSGPSLAQQFSSGVGNYRPAGMSTMPHTPAASAVQPAPAAQPGPMTYGSPMPAPNTPGMATGYPGNAPMPQGAPANSYGGYMQPGGSAQPAPAPTNPYSGYMQPPGGMPGA